MIRKIIPQRLRKLVRKQKIFYMACKSFFYDLKRYITYSNTIKINDTEKIERKIIAEYHAIEKGLTMPNMRFNFGKAVLNDLISNCLEYNEKYGFNDDQFQHAVSVIAEYKHKHEIHDQTLDFDLNNRITVLLNLLPEIEKSNQHTITKSLYFQQTRSSFDLFSMSRHSLRNFDGHISNELIEKSVKLAQTAPSACNRQPIKVYIVENKDKIDQLLALQTGNRGFVYLADKIIVLSAELAKYAGLRERNLSYVDGGIYTMNLLYALHFHQIGACTLNWCVDVENDRKIHKLINIPDSEVVIVLIACGAAPEEFNLACSKRNDVSIVTI